MMGGQPETSLRSLKAYVVGTIDTKGEELRYVRDLITEAGIPTVLVDVGPRSQDSRCDVRSTEVATYHGASSAAILSNDRGKAIEAMAQAFSNFLPSRKDVGGVIGLGGSGGSAIISPGLQALPIGVPKIMVSTLASGDVSAYIGTSDIQMVNPVTDIAGLNSVSRVVLGNAAHSLAGMMLRPIERIEGSNPAIGLTMYGVTTPCVRLVTGSLSKAQDPPPQFLHYACPHHSGREPDRRKLDRRETESMRGIGSISHSGKRAFPRLMRPNRRFLIQKRTKPSLARSKRRFE